jgi:hypothetical protein
MINAVETKEEAEAHPETHSEPHVETHHEEHAEAHEDTHTEPHADGNTETHLVPVESNEKEESRTEVKKEEQPIKRIRSERDRPAIEE